MTRPAILTAWLLAQIIPGPAPSAFMLPGWRVEPPAAFQAFCARDPEECAPRLAQTIALRDRGDDLAAINAAVNKEIEPVTDAELYGVSDYWTIPTTRGDCEDMALLKRHRLMAAGWT
jgi:predicted transglutaminase-like cysteine proteinase